ncbi:MAG: lysophospholipase [Dehalococcoidales bacterium]|nr:lysophospholipase [Dehalococcoidales bacterium]
MQHVESTFAGQHGLSLYYQAWLPDKEPKSVLVVVHGLAEHSGRYRHLAEYFASRGHAVYSFDLEGHGRSAGPRCRNNNFSDFMKNLDIFLALVRRKHPSPKIFIIGHSMGGTIATLFAASGQSQFDGLILSAATLKIGAKIPPPLFLAARVLSLLAPGTGLYTIEAAALSRDKSVVEAYLKDHLVYTGKIRARPGVELLKVLNSLPDRYRDITLPLLIMQGTADRLSDPEGSRIMYREVASQDKTLKIYPGFYHELFNEQEHRQVFADMEEWLDRRIQHCGDLGK